MLIRTISHMLLKKVVASYCSPSLCTIGIAAIGWSAMPAMLHRPARVPERHLPSSAAHAPAAPAAEK
jgi:hypothetical protein